MAKVRGREEPVSVTYAGVKITGVSVAGRETWFHLPSMDLAFDLGRAPTELVPVPNVFLSHAHLDHAAGLAYWCSQRRLMRHAGGVVRTVPETVSAWRKLLAIHESLEDVRYDARVEPIAPGESVTLRKDLSVTAFRVDHRVPGLGFCASEMRNRVVEAWRGRSEAEIAAALKAGQKVTERVAIPLVAFCGDTAKGIFKLAPPAVFRAKVLLLECSFVEDRHLDRAGDWGHLHLSEIAERADIFENEVLVLTHLTLRTGPLDIRNELKRALPASLAARTVPFLPDGGA